MKRRTWMILGSLFALALGLGLVACGSLHPAPQVVVWNVDPIRISVSDTTASTVDVLFANMNNVDAVIHSETWTFLGTGTPSPVTIYIPAGDTVEVTYDFAVPSKVAYRNSMIAAGVTNATIVITYSGEDMYGNGKTFQTTANIALVRYN